MPPFDASYFSSVLSKRVYQIALKYKPDADPQKAAHLCTNILFHIFCGIVFVNPLSAVPPSTRISVECLRYTRVTALTLKPA